MSIIDIPTALSITRMTWAQQRNDSEFRSMFGAQAIEVSAPLWAVSFEVTTKRDSDSMVGEWKALLLLLRGRVNQIALYDMGRPTPLGTMRGAMTLSIAAAQGDTFLNIVAAGENAKTILKGDMLGIGSTITQQVVMATADAISDGSGNILVNFEPPIRNVFPIGEPVTWDKPKALFRRTDSKTGWDYNSVFVSGFSLDVLEDWRP